jgi:hypothetical protein
MPGRRGTAEAIQERRYVVEAALVAGEWSLRVQAQLANRYSVSPSQIRRDAAWVRQQWAAQESELSLEDRHAHWRQRLDQTYRQAVKDGHSITVAKLLSMEARVEGFDAPQRLQIDARVQVEADPDAVARQLLEAVPMLCEVLGVEAPLLELPVLDAEPITKEV